MIDFESWSFFAAPRTGSTWMIHAANAMGFHTPMAFAKHDLPRQVDRARLSVTLVRHPFTWAVSLHEALRGGMIGEQGVNAVASLSRQYSQTKDFLDAVIERPGIITAAFAPYTESASTVMRIEDMPWAAVEFFMSMGRWDEEKIKEAILKLSPVNVRKIRNDGAYAEQRKQIVKNEKEFCQRFEYHW